MQKAEALAGIETVLLDVDGTLIDSNGAHAETWVAALHEHGLAVEVGRIRALIGMGGDKLLPAVAAISAESPRGQAIAQRKQELFAARLHDLQPTRGARRLLEYLTQRGTRLAVASSGDEAEVDALLHQAGVADLIPERTSKDDAPQSKPSPDVVAAAMTASDARAKSTILVGDTPYDLEAAARAGIRAIALRCGGYWPDPDLRGAVGIFDDPEALLMHWRQSAT